MAAVCLPVICTEPQSVQTYMHKFLSVHWVLIMQRALNIDIYIGSVQTNAWISEMETATCSCSMPSVNMCQEPGNMQIALQSYIIAICGEKTSLRGSDSLLPNT